MRRVAIGGSDSGISAALRARELDPPAEVTVVLADTYPNFSIRGIPYYISGDVADWRNLAHRTRADLEAAGIKLRLDTIVQRIDPHGPRVYVAADEGDAIEYDALVVGTGARPVKPPVAGLDRLGPADGVHLLHTMGDTHALVPTLEQRHAKRAVIVGAGYVGLEMAEVLEARGVAAVTHLEQLPEVLPTVDPELGTLVRAELERNGVQVLCEALVNEVREAPPDPRADFVSAPPKTRGHSTSRRTSCSSRSASARTVD